MSGKPFPYILRDAEFYHHHFFVNENVLIPRPETEHLVDMIVRKNKKYQAMLDIGTGSGVILLSLLRAGISEKGMGSDISSEALEITAINVQRLRLKNRVSLVKSDRLINISESFDLIVSNPPYIKKTSHRSMVQSSVDIHEPHLALYLDDSQYEAWFMELFQGVRNQLAPGGDFWMEGHEKELAHQAEILKALGFYSVKVIQDYSGLDRFLSASLPL